MNRNTIIAAALSSSLLLSSPAHAGGGLAGMATEFTQIANNVELVGIYAENVAQLQQLIQQYQNMIQNTLNLPQQLWPPILVQIQDLINTIGAIDSAANATQNALAQFASHYNFNPSAQAAMEVNRWRTGVKNQIAATLRQMGLNANRMKDTQSALAEVMALSQSAQGRMQVLQAGNQIASMMVNEVQNLHSTIMMAEQAQSNYYATKLREKEVEEEAVRKFFTEQSVRF